jgi:hypothetical protein
LELSESGNRAVIEASGLVKILMPVGADKPVYAPYVEHVLPDGLTGPAAPYVHAHARAYESERKTVMFSKGRPAGMSAADGLSLMGQIAKPSRDMPRKGAC